MTSFPDNFLRLHAGEEFLRAKSIEAIEADADLTMHAAALASSMDLIDYFARHYANETDDQLTIQLLGIRLFNGTASALISDVRAATACFAFACNAVCSF